jgi:hypothetical protein
MLPSFCESNGERLVANADAKGRKVFRPPVASPLCKVAPSGHGPDSRLSVDHSHYISMRQ